VKFSSQPEERRLDLTVLPMVNIVFLLLIFFMLVGRIGPTGELEVSPPVSPSGQVETGQSLRVEIGANGEMALDGRGIDMTEMIVMLTDILRQDPATQIQLNADAELDANRLIKIMETLRLIGVAKLTLVTEHEG
jgi:biopolymer transport protein ExbD